MQVSFPLRKICPRLISQQNISSCTKTAVCRLDGNSKKCQKILAFVEDQQQIVEFVIILVCSTFYGTFAFKGSLTLVNLPSRRILEYIKHFV